MNREEWRAWAAIDDSDKPGNPWGIDAVEQLEQIGDYGACADSVIVTWLCHGDTRPLAQMFQLGIAPTPAVLKVVGHMLTGDDGGALSTGHQLTVKRSGPGHPGGGPEKAIRDRHVADRVRERVQAGGYDAAFKEVTAIVNEDGPTIGEETVRKAYGRHYGKKR